MPKDPATGKRHEATLVERVKVIEKHAARKCYRAIGEEIGISKSEAQRIIQRWKEFEESRRGARELGGRQSTPLERRWQRGGGSIGCEFWFCLSLPLRRGEVMGREGRRLTVC